MTKGILVLLMVVYHSLNYTNQYHLSFRYLSFLPPSFILITGLLITHVYCARFDLGDRQIIRRLLIRGLKLLALFTALNIIAQFIRSPVYGHAIGVVTFFRNWIKIYFLGSERAAVFEVLLPIAYILLLAPGIIWLTHRRPVFLALITTGTVVTCAIMDQTGRSLTNLNLVSVGLVGMLVGRLLSNPYTLSSYFAATLLAYCLYFPLGLARGYVYLVQLLGACIAVALICSASTKLGENGWCQQRIIKLGQYSLLAYIVQIAILQTLSRFIGRPDPLSIQSSVLLLGTLVLMTLTIEGVEWFRTRSIGADRTYKVIFA
jgi:hypothetical protein